MNYRFPTCERCGAECVGLQLPPGWQAPIHCIGCINATRPTSEAQATALPPQALAELQVVVERAVRALEHDMVSPRPPRATIAWKSLSAGVVLGAAIACALAHCCGGHF
jgi:hypothetical protein